MKNKHYWLEEIEKILKSNNVPVIKWKKKEYLLSPKIYSLMLQFARECLPEKKKKLPKNDNWTHITFVRDMVEILNQGYNNGIGDMEAHIQQVEEEV